MMSLIWSQGEEGTGSELSLESEPSSNDLDGAELPLLSLMIKRRMLHSL